MFMKKIYDIFIGKNFSLPNNFLIPNYDTFLFFDFGLGMDLEFLEEFSDLLDLGGFNKQVNVLDCDFNIIVENRILEHDNLIKNIQRITGSLNDYGNSGVIMADTDLNWVAVQDIPINWGVFAFQSSKKESIRDLCKIPFPPTAETQTQVFVYFRPPITPNFTQIPP